MEFAFVGPILTLLTSQAFRDFWRKWKLDESLRSNLKSYLRVIGAVLNYADDAQIDDSNIKDWLEDVKDVLYDAEDLLDEIEILASTSFVKKKSTNRRLKSMVRIRIPRFVKKKSINRRMKSMVEKLKTISDQKDSLKLKETDGKKRSEINGRLTTPVIDESKCIYGRDQDKKKIINLLDQTDEGENNRVSVIVIHGMGGLGKTTLAQIVYNDIRKRAQMRFDVQAWACVSDTFDKVKTTKDLLESATRKRSKDGDNLELLQDALKTELGDKRFLLVLDDIWPHKNDDWEGLFVPFSVGKEGSKIIVTTRDANVINAINSINHQVIPHELRTLDEEDCWLLFEGIAFRNGNSSDFPELEAIGKQIVKKCKGLPLAAKTIGGVLRNKQEDEKQWEDVLNSSVWGSRNQKYLPALILSYHHLPVEERQCFAYCSLFPKDYRFRKEELVLLWTAEGFVSSADGNGDLEAAGERCFSNLLSMSFFQRYRYSESSYVMHDLIHDLAQFVSGKSYLRKDEAYEEDEEKNTTSIKVRRFSFPQRPSMKFKPIKCLRTFFPFGDTYYLTKKVPKKVPNQLLLSQMKFLRVLSLRGFESVSELPDSVGDLKHLRYLDLSYTNISCLPDTINDLHNLQTLLLARCNRLTRLSASMEGLVKLRHLRLDGTKLTHMPAGMEKMTQLRTLSNFLVGRKNGPEIAVLKNLSNLQEKLHISGLSNVVKATDAIDANFQQKKYLNEVILDWSDWGAVSSSPRNRNVEEEFMRKLSFHTNLTELTIRGYGGKKFPEWIKDLTKLVYLEISDCRYCESLASSLGKLSCLKYLIIRGLDCIQDLTVNGCESLGPIEDRGLDVLKSLEIYDCPRVTRLPEGCISLERLFIKRCTSLDSLPQLPGTLMELTVRGCDSLGPIEDWGLDELESLVDFNFGNVPSLKSFEPLLLPKSITRLGLHELPNLKTISNGLKNLTSLRGLWILNCVKLKSLPEEGLPETLGFLFIENCPLLKRRCEKGGADWSKIADIPQFVYRIW